MDVAFRGSRIFDVARGILYWAFEWEEDWVDMWFDDRASWKRWLSLPEHCRPPLSCRLWSYQAMVCDPGGPVSDAEYAAAKSFLVRMNLVVLHPTLDADARLWTYEPCGLTDKGRNVVKAHGFAGYAPLCVGGPVRYHYGRGYSFGSILHIDRYIIRGAANP